MTTEILEATAACRVVEQELAAAIERGATQYVAIGESCEDLERRLPGNMQVFCLPLEFDSAADDGVSSFLAQKGFGTGAITFVSWLGGRISTVQTVFSILRMIGCLPSLSALLFDYVVRRRSTSQGDPTAMDALASEMGEPVCRYTDPQALHTLLRASGFSRIEELSTEPGSGRRLVLALV